MSMLPINTFLLATVSAPAQLWVDLDEDGVREAVIVSFSALQELLVTVVEPEGDRTTLNLGAFPDGGEQADFVGLAVHELGSEGLVEADLSGHSDLLLLGPLVWSMRE